MRVVQLVERNLAMVEVEGSTPFSHSNYDDYSCGCSASDNTSYFQSEIEGLIPSRRSNHWDVLDVNT